MVGISMIIFAYFLFVIRAPGINGDNNATSTTATIIDNNKLRDYFRKACKLTPSVTSPNDFDPRRVPIQTTASLMLNNLIGIDDVEETMTYNGALGLTFQIKCLRDLAYSLNKTQFVPTRWIVSDASDYFLPAIVHLNSPIDYGLKDNVYPSIQIYPFQGLYAYVISGVFTCSVNLNFKRFPWGVSTGTANFGIWMSTHMINITMSNSVAFISEDPFVSKNSGWRFLGATAGYSLNAGSGPDFMFPVVELRLNFARKPDYYVINILVPCMFLTIVQLATAVLPPEDGTRATFAVTILLSFTMIQGQVIANIPKTPEDVLLSDLVLGESILSLLVTFYAAISSAFADSWQFKAQEEVTLFNTIQCRRYRAIDTVALMAFGGVMIFLNFFFIKRMITDDE